MTEFEQVLEECLRDLEQGASTLDQCLSRHPKHAQQLRPVLLTDAYLEHARETRPSAAFKARVRARLTRDMQAYPRGRAGFNFAFLRLAMSFALIVLALLLTGTVYAQGALPGDLLYSWKLASENVWRAVSRDPVGTDLAIAQRRVDELIAVGNDPALRSQALEEYLKVAARLRSETDAENQLRILLELDSQAEELNQSGIPIPRPEQEVVPQLDVPTLIVPVTPEIPVSTPELPQVNPTDLPQIVPTVQVPPLIP